MTAGSTPLFFEQPSRERASFHYQLEDQAAPPLVSVVWVLSESGGDFVATASMIQRQSLQQIEWVLVDAGASQEDVAVAKAWAAEDCRVRLFSRTYLSCPKAKNFGVRAAAGEFVLFIDPEERLEPTVAEKFYWFLLAHPRFSAVACTAVMSEADGREALDTSSIPLPSRDSAVSKTMLVRRKCFVQLGGLRDAPSEQESLRDFWERFYERGFLSGHFADHLKWRRSLEGSDCRFDASLTEFVSSPWIANDALAATEAPVAAVRLDAVRAKAPPMARFNVLQKSKPRLLLCVPFLTMGGSEKAVLDIIDQLVGHGWEVTVLATSDIDNEWLAEFSQVTPDVFILPHFIDPQYSPFQWISFLRYLMESRQFDAVLNSNSPFGLTLLPYWRHYYPNCIYAAVRHAANWPRRSDEYHHLLDFTLVSFDRLRKDLLELGYPKDKLVVYYTNVDTNVWRPDASASQTIRRRLGISAELPVIVYAARMVNAKQPQVFAETVRRLHARGLKFAAVATGHGPLLGWMQDFVARHKLENVLHLLGRVPSSEMPQIMASGDVLFLPSQVEGIAMTVFEAMACGLAVVTSDVGGQSELVTPECGALVARGTAAEEIGAYEHILAGLLDCPEKLKAMGGASFNRIQCGFQITQMGDRVDGLFRQAVQEAHKNAHPLISVEQAEKATTTALEQAYQDLQLAVLESRLRGEINQSSLTFTATLIHLTSRYLAQRPQTRWVRAIRATGRKLRQAKRLAGRLKNGNGRAA